MGTGGWFCPRGCTQSHEPPFCMSDRGESCRVQVRGLSTLSKSMTPFVGQNLCEAPAEWTGVDITVERHSEPVSLFSFQKAIIILDITSMVFISNRRMVTFVALPPVDGSAHADAHSPMNHHFAFPTAGAPVACQELPAGLWRRRPLTQMRWARPRRL